MSCIYSHEDGAYCDKYSNGAVTLSCSGEEDCPDRIVKTNADRIRQMSDEELADMFWEFMTDSQFKNPYREKAELLDWLKATVEEGEG